MGAFISRLVEVVGALALGTRNTSRSAVLSSAQR